MKFRFVLTKINLLYIQDLNYHGVSIDAVTRSVLGKFNCIIISIKFSPMLRIVPEWDIILRRKTVD